METNNLHFSATHHHISNNLIKLHIAAVPFKGDNKFTNNFARQILYASSSSYVVI